MIGGRAKAEYGQRRAVPSARLRIPAAKQIALHNSVMFDETEQGDEPQHQLHTILSLQHPKLT